MRASDCLGAQLELHVRIGVFARRGSREWLRFFVATTLLLSPTCADDQWSVTSGVFPDEMRLPFPWGKEKSERDTLHDAAAFGVCNVPRPTKIEAHSLLPLRAKHSDPNMQASCAQHGNPEASIPSVHAVLQGLDPNLPIPEAHDPARPIRQVLLAGPSLCPPLPSFLAIHRRVAGGHWPVRHARPIAFDRRTSESASAWRSAHSTGNAVLILRESLLVAGPPFFAGVPVAMLAHALMRSMLFGGPARDLISFLLALSR